VPIKGLGNLNFVIYLRLLQGTLRLLLSPPCGIQVPIKGLGNLNFVISRNG